MIIDFHTHTFPDHIAAATVEKLGKAADIRPHTDGSVSGLVKSMHAAAVDLSIVVPVATNPRQVAKINDTAAAINQNTPQTGVHSFGGIHPDTENYREELQKIKDLGLLGVKLHPNYQNCYADDPRYLRIVDFAASLGLVVIIHAGVDIGLPEPQYSAPKRIARILSEVSPEKFVLAHMGGWRMWDEVCECIVGKDVYLDTSFCLGPADRQSTAQGEPLMEQETFLKLVRLHGEDRILFGTDSPWSDQKLSVSELARYPLSVVQKQKIYYQNAAALLGLSI